jgi:hypothetical protein
MPSAHSRPPYSPGFHAPCSLPLVFLTALPAATRRRHCAAECDPPPFARYSLDEMERALHDAMCVIKRVLESNDVVPGGGAASTRDRAPYLRICHSRNSATGVPARCKLRKPQRIGTHRR